ncbi:MAG: hypothetical protein ABII00_09980 [Elusimicrobiota bacterium]
MKLSNDNAMGGLQLLLWESALLAASWWISVVEIRASLALWPAHALLPFAAAFGFTGLTIGALAKGYRTKSLRDADRLDRIFLVWLMLWPARRPSLDALAAAVGAGSLAGVLLGLGVGVPIAAAVSAFFMFLVFVPAFYRMPRPATGLDPNNVFVGLGTGGLVFFQGVMAASSDPTLARLAVAGLAAGLLMQVTQAREEAGRRWNDLSAAPPPPLDLDRYRLTVERKGPKAPTAARPQETVDNDGARFVGSGSFRVDAAKMVEKLRERQLADPEDSLLPLLRCAVASGASDIALKRVPGGLEIRFDGRPIVARQLSQPYQALLAEADADGPRGRHFAYGLLALQRLKPRFIHVVSGDPSGHAEMNLLARGVQAGYAGMDPDDGTLIQVRWGWMRGWWWRSKLLARARKHWGLAEPTLSVGGVPVPSTPSPKAAGWRIIREAGWDGSWRPLPSAEESRVRLYTLGVLVEEVAEDLGRRQVEAYLASDDLTLDISQARVVRDAQFREGMDILQRKAAQAERA